jgi:very-short-patch-repair endonuclease
MTARHESTSPCKGEVGRAAAGRGSRPRFSRTLQMTSRARRLRANLTDAEQKLWRALRRNQIGNFNFRRQHPLGPYTLDFYCPQLLLGIEVDGGQHNEKLRRTSDNRRTSWLESKGISVIRFWNNEVLQNLDGVLSEINRVVVPRSEVTPSPTLPLSGGGRNGVVP